MEEGMILSFCHADQILVPKFLLIRAIRRIRWLKLLTMHYNDYGILIQSLEHPRELSMRLSAEQAVKVPIRPL
jgi:hypothetical protein